MEIRVECQIDEHGAQTPSRIIFDRHAVEVTEVIDRWPGADHEYFKLLGADQATYILRRDLRRQSWEMTMYQSADAEEAARSAPGEP